MQLCESATDVKQTIHSSKQGRVNMNTADDDKRKIAHGPSVHAIKRAKYEAKQERLRQAAEQEQQRRQTTSSHHHTYAVQNVNHAQGLAKWSSWVDKDRETRATRSEFVTAEDVREIRQMRMGKQRCNNFPSQPTDASCGTSLGGYKGNEAQADPKEDGERRGRLLRIMEWIEPFFDLKEVPSTAGNTDNLSKGTHTNSRLFVAEGTEAVRLMMQKCEHRPISDSCGVNESGGMNPPVHLLSILSKPSTFFDPPTCLIDELKDYSTNEALPFNIIIGTEDALTEIVGFPVARGAMVCGAVPTYNNAYQSLKNLLMRSTVDETGVGREQTPEAVTPKTIIPTEITQPQQRQIKRIIALDAISNTSNMGSILRTAAAFGVDVILLSDDSCDAWYRQSVRVSMGHVATVPTMRVGEWMKGRLDVGEEGDKRETGLVCVLKWLRDQANVVCYAAVVDDELDDTAAAQNGVGNDSIPALVTLESLSGRYNSTCLVLGNEGHGIRRSVINECDYRIKIGMSNCVDSLSLPVAAGILIHGMCSRQL